MTKWEYKTIKVSGSAKSIFGGGKLILDGQFNELGAEGWELVSVVTLSLSGSSGVQAIFKRPLE